MVIPFFGCVFGILDILTIGWIFVPLAVLFAIIGLLTNLGSRDFGGFFLSVIAGILAVVGYTPIADALAGHLHRRGNLACATFDKLAACGNRASRNAK